MQWLIYECSQAREFCAMMEVKGNTQFQTDDGWLQHTLHLKWFKPAGNVLPHIGDMGSISAHVISLFYLFTSGYVQNEILSAVSCLLF